MPVSAAHQEPPEEEFLPTRNSLLSRLRNWDDQEGWRTFFDTYGRFLFQLATRAGLAPDDARDVVQDTVVGVAQGLRAGRFQATQGGSFKAWLQQIVRRRVGDYFRRRAVRIPSAPAEDPGANGTPLVERVPDPAGNAVDAIWEEEWTRHIAAMALSQVKQKVSARQFQMFDLYVLKEWPVREVARMLHVHTAQVYLAKHRITALLRRETTLLRQRLERDGGLHP